jgi:hypothetical protein
MQRHMSIIPRIFTIVEKNIPANADWKRQLDKKFFIFKMRG